MTEWRVDSEEIFPKGDNPLGNKFYGYRKTRLTLPDGRTATYFGALVGPCVHVVALEPNETTYFVQQKRPNVRRPQSGDPVPTLLELPGGFVGDRTILQAGQEELGEEVGRQASTLEHVGTLYPSVGISDEQDHVLMGTGLAAAGRSEVVEATEQDLRVVALPFGRAYDHMLRGEMPVSAQTVAALALVAARL
jgi:hypothetical protein